MDLLVTAMTETKSTDPAKVAKAMEGKKLSGYFGEIEMRKDDHQMIQPLLLKRASEEAKTETQPEPPELAAV